MPKRSQRKQRKFLKQELPRLIASGEVGTTHQPTLELARERVRQLDLAMRMREGGNLTPSEKKLVRALLAGNVKVEHLPGGEIRYRLARQGTGGAKKRAPTKTKWVARSPTKVKRSGKKSKHAKRGGMPKHEQKKKKQPKEEKPKEKKGLFD